MPSPPLTAPHKGSYPALVLKSPVTYQRPRDRDTGNLALVHARYPRSQAVQTPAEGWQGTGIRKGTGKKTNLALAQGLLAPLYLQILRFLITRTRHSLLSVLALENCMSWGDGAGGGGGVCGGALGLIG